MKKRAAYLIFALLIAFMMPVTAFANADLPPFLTVIVENPPEDLELSVEIPPENFSEYQDAPKEVIIRPHELAWETHYRFRVIGYNYDEIALNNVTLVVTAGGKTFRCDIPEEELWNYNGFVTLDIDDETLIPGTKPGRTALLAALRISVTLLLEGVLFFIWGMRKTKSWIIFLVTNLITQGWLNIYVAGPKHNQYFVMAVALFEILFFIVEGIAFFIFIKEFSEKKGGKAGAFAFAFFANVLSYIVGSRMLTWLPV
ncbi:MAG: hypothetical protein J6J07_06570 [Oscillospiraceae bacterium]|nr:hypothetical protein [Oscillospiraceae bacterium]